MQYRKFGKLKWKSSALGLGLAGLYSLKEAEAVKVIRAAVYSGINLIDVQWPLAEKSHKELSIALKKALADGYREKVKICGMIPPVKINTAADFERALEELLKWLNADSVDFLMLGGLNRFTWPRLHDLKILKAMGKTVAGKKAGHLGFFFHDQYQFLREVIQAYDNWTFCQFHYSFMDVDHHPGYGGIKLAADRGLAVIASKLLLGGRLEHNIPPTVAKVWAEASPKRSPAEWALRWIWNQPEIAAAVSDMDTVELIEKFAAIADKALPDSFDVPEELVINKARDAYLALKPIPCTACRGCMPSGGLCPNGIDVPRVFEIYNDAVMYNAVNTGRYIFAMEHHDLDACTECGTCVCGKKIPIPEWLKKAKKMLAVGK